MNRSCGKPRPTDRPGSGGSVGANVGANVGILVASNVGMSVLLYFMTKKQFHKVHSEALHKLGHLVNPTNIQTQQGASAAGVGMAIGAH